MWIFQRILMNQCCFLDFGGLFCLLSALESSELSYAVSIQEAFQLCSFSSCDAHDYSERRVGLPKRGWPKLITVPEHTLCRHWQRTEAAALLMCCFHDAGCVDTDNNWLRQVHTHLLIKLICIFLTHYIATRTEWKDSYHHPIVFTAAAAFKQTSLPKY